MHHITRTEKKRNRIYKPHTRIANNGSHIFFLFGRCVNENSEGILLVYASTSPLCVICLNFLRNFYGNEDFYVFLYD